MAEASPHVQLDEQRLEREARWLRALARALVQDEHVAADLAQDAWVKALEAPPRAGLSARAWWKRVLRRAAGRRAERDAARRRREAAAARAESLPAEDRARERAEIAQRVANAVAALAEPYRSAIVLRYFEELPPREIARQLGVPLATVKSRLARALRELRAQLDRTDDAPTAAWLPALSLWAYSVPQGSAAAAIASVGGAAMKGKLAIAAVLLLLVAGAGWQIVQSTDGERASGALARSEEPGTESRVAAARPDSAPSISRGSASTPIEESPRAGAERTDELSASRRLQLEILDFEGRAIAGGSVEVAEGTAALHRWIRERGEPDPGIARVALAGDVVELSPEAHLLRPALERFVALELLEIRSDAPQELPPQVLRVDRARTLEVRVIDPERKRVAGIEVVLGPDGRGKRERSGGAAGVAVRALEERARLSDAEGVIKVEIGTSEVWHLSTSANDVWGSAYLPIEPGVQDLCLEIELHRAEGPIFRGRLFDPAGAPIAGARVFFPDLSGFACFTDAEGRFGFTGAPLFYGLRAEADGFVGRSFHPLESALGEERTIVLERGGALAGYVIGAYGAAREPHRLEVVPLDPERAGERDELRTDASGNFVFRFLREGPHLLRATDESLRTLGALRVNVPDAEVELRLGHGLELARTVRGIALGALDRRPLPGVAISASVAHGDGSAWTTSERLSTRSDEHGRFELADLPWAPVMISVEAAEHVPLLVQPRLYSSGSTELELLLDREVSLNVRVIDAEGRAVAEAQVTAEDEQGHTLSLRTSPHSFSVFAHTDPEGRVRLAGLPAKRLALAARTSDWQSVEPVAIDAASASGEIALRLPVVVARGGRPVELELARLPELAGAKAVLRVFDTGDRVFAHLALERDAEGWFARLPQVRRLPASRRIAIELPDVELRAELASGEEVLERRVERSARAVVLGS